MLIGRRASSGRQMIDGHILLCGYVETIRKPVELGAFDRERPVRFDRQIGRRWRVSNHGVEVTIPRHDEHVAQLVRNNSH